MGHLFSSWSGIHFPSPWPGPACALTSEHSRSDYLPVLSLDLKRLCGLSGSLWRSPLPGEQVQRSLLKCEKPHGVETVLAEAILWPTHQMSIDLCSSASERTSPEQCPAHARTCRFLRTVRCYSCMPMGVGGYLVHIVIMVTDNWYSVSKSCLMKANYGTKVQGSI